MKRVLIIDTETTGLDPATDVVIEVGCLLQSIEHATVLEAFSSLIHADSNAAESVNRIPAASLADAPKADDVWARVIWMLAGAEAILAHNAEFDRSFSPAVLRDRRPWVCTKRDVEWPKANRPESSLVPLALEHDLGVAVAHRALADCDLIARLLTRCAELGHDLEAMLARAMRPKMMLRALVSYDDRELAKAAGFRWDPAMREWRRRMVAEDAASLAFPTVAVTERTA